MVDDASADLRVNDPDVVREIETEFDGYNKALNANDVAALNRFFKKSADTTRYGIAENLYGFDEIASYRSGYVPKGPPRERERTQITTFGRSFATVATLTRHPGKKVGRTTQTWVRFPEGWRIVCAHVSNIELP